MLRPTDELAAFERRYAREVLAGLSYHEALSHFAGLWVEARRLNSGFPAGWREDIDADLELARVLNGLPDRP